MMSDRLATEIRSVQERIRDRISAFLRESDEASGFDTGDAIDLFRSVLRDAENCTNLLTTHKPYKLLFSVERQEPGLNEVVLGPVLVQEYGTMEDAIADTKRMGEILTFVRAK